MTRPPAVRAASAVDPAPCWCGAAEWRVCFRTPRFGLVQCGRCGGYRLDPRPLQSSANVQPFYEEFYATLIATGYPMNGAGPRHSRFWRVAAAVPALAAPGARAADIGSGDGRLCSELLHAGWRDVIGVELSSARRERARRNCPGSRFYASIEEAHLGPASMNLIVLDNVVEHLLQPAEVVADLRRALVSQGRMVLITPNMDSGHFKLLGRRWTTELSPDQHIHLFSASPLRRLLTEAGFEIEAVGSFHLPPLPPREWLSDFDGSPLRTTVWRMGQEAGALFGRLIGEGPMLYAVGRAA